MAGLARKRTDPCCIEWTQYNGNSAGIVSWYSSGDWFWRHELTSEQGCILWGIWVTVPQKLQQQVRLELHQSHPGIARMKVKARSYIWWPGLDGDLDTLVCSCTKCQSCQSMPAVALLRPSLALAFSAMAMLHIDYAGSVDGRMLLIIVNAHCKWPEVIPMSSTTSQTAIRALGQLFASHGLPQLLVWDNGPQFSADEFITFLTQMVLITFVVLPTTNGLAECFEHTLKKALRTSNSVDPHQNLMSFLLSYHSTPNSTTNSTPSELFVHWSLQLE